MADDRERDAIRFGRLVRQQREARSWSQEALAAAAFSNSTRKGYVSQIESGKIPNPTRETVRNLARALGIDPEQIPPALRWPEALETVKDTHAVVHDIRAQVDELVASLRDQARAFGIREGMLIALARRYAEGSPENFDAALAGLERALEVVRDERERGRLPSNISSAVDAVIERIDALNERGDLNAAQSTLDQELAHLDAEDDLRRAARARLYEKGISQAILSRDVENACRFVLARFDLDAPRDGEERYRALRAQFIEWYQRGEDKGLNFDLEVAVGLAREAVIRAETLDQRGAMRTNLGTALGALGARESGTMHLLEAVSALRAALEERSRDRVPLDWATTQNNLGNALSKLGEREGGTERLREAVGAYRAALEVRTRNRSPMQWATTQSNLGAVLSMLDDREPGTEQLEAAIAGYRAALEVRSRDLVPLEWAATQNNLGAALARLGKRLNEMKWVEEAVVAFRATLEVYTRDSVPLDWAMTQHNLGNALSVLGQNELGTARLEGAVAAYRVSLEECTRDRAPLDWATTQTGLGNTLMLLGARELGTERLEEAIGAFRIALEVRTPDRMPHGWAVTSGYEGMALRILAERRRDLALAEQALHQIQMARETFEALGDERKAVAAGAEAQVARQLVERLRAGG